MFCHIRFSSDETASEAVKEQGDLSVPLGGCSTTSQDVDSSPVSTSANENSPLPSNESTSTPQASPSSVPADGGETHARKMGKLHMYIRTYQFICSVVVLHISVQHTVAQYGQVQVAMQLCALHNQQCEKLSTRDP